MVARPLSFWPAGVLLALSLVVTGCSRSTAPAKTYSIGGRVQLRTQAYSASSAALGTRTIDDADGVPVWLLHGSETVAITHTTGGAFQFTQLPPGSYIARTGVYAPIQVPSPYLILTSADIRLASPLVLGTTGDLVPAPNPVGSSTLVWFDVVTARNGPDSVHVLVRVRDASGGSIARLMDQTIAPGLHSVFWNGRDSVNRLLSGRFYWLTYSTDTGDERQALLLP